MNVYDHLTNIKAVLFDVDDTLIDRNKSQIKILNIIIENFKDIFYAHKYHEIYNAFISSDFILNSLIAKGEKIADARLERSKIFLKLLNIDVKYAEDITKMYLESYLKYLFPMEDAKFVIKELANYFNLGIVSNGFADIQYYKIERLGIKRFFKCIILSDEIGIRKPNPMIFLEAAKRLNINPNKCMYVGDSYENDVAGSRKAGMKACWMNAKNIKVRYFDIYPDIEIKKLRDLLLLPKLIHSVKNE